MIVQIMTKLKIISYYRIENLFVKNNISIIYLSWQVNNENCKFEKIKKPSLEVLKLWFHSNWELIWWCIFRYAFGLYKIVLLMSNNMLFHLSLVPKDLGYFCKKQITNILMCVHEIWNDFIVSNWCGIS